MRDQKNEQGRRNEGSGEEEPQFEWGVIEAVFETVKAGHCEPDYVRYLAGELQWLVDHCEKSARVEG